jgi:hypothetical protein
LKTNILIATFAILLFSGCRKSREVIDTTIPIQNEALQCIQIKIGDSLNCVDCRDIAVSSSLRFRFSAPLDKNSISKSIIFNSLTKAIPFTYSLENNDSTLLIAPINSLDHLTKHFVNISTDLRGRNSGSLKSILSLKFTTPLDPTDKFPIISDEELLTLVQKQTFKYFWDFAHPVSGLARERNTSGDVVTSGGSGFGIMTIPVAIERKFITRAQGLERMQKIVAFLNEKAQKFHGAFPHWLNGSTGAVVPFSTKDNGADLVETSFLIQGLLTSRQYFNNGSDAEVALRADINKIWHAVEWNWFTKGSENVLYWHWSPDYNWEMNLPIRGWNECLITYALAASSPTHPISKSVYENGWTGKGSFVNGKEYYGIKLPLGEPFGGSLFLSHYSFLGVNPTDLTDNYTNYLTQNRSHALINYNYCKTNPSNHAGYSDSSWGLTASDIPGGYTASSPTNDRGVIAPTAALSSFPYTPTESMRALKFFYYKLGDKIWGEYGFRDAFSLDQLWFADSYLAIDQGPIVIMIENHRTAMLWNLFMSCPEVKTGMKSIGFQSPRL